MSGFQKPLCHPRAAAVAPRSSGCTAHSSSFLRPGLGYHCFQTYTWKAEGSAKPHPYFLQKSSLKRSVISRPTTSVFILYCACECVCTAVFMPQCTWRGQGTPQVLALAFHTACGQPSSCSALCMRLAGPSFQGIPVSISHLPVGALALQTCATMSSFTWVMGIQTQVSTLEQP